MRNKEVYQGYDNIRDVLRVPYRMVGVGAGAPTLEEGTSITITRAAAGRYVMTLADKVTELIAATANIMAATPADVKGHTCVFDTFATNNAIEVSLYDAQATPALRDLAANEYIMGELIFRMTDLEG